MKINSSNTYFVKLRSAFLSNIISSTFFNYISQLVSIRLSLLPAKAIKTSVYFLFSSRIVAGLLSTEEREDRGHNKTASGEQRQRTEHHGSNKDRNKRASSESAHGARLKRMDSDKSRLVRAAATRGADHHLPPRTLDK